MTGLVQHMAEVERNWFRLLRAAVAAAGFQVPAKNSK
jgi:hypothetical protein